MGVGVNMYLQGVFAYFYLFKYVILIGFTKNQPLC